MSVLLPTAVCADSILSTLIPATTDGEVVAKHDDEVGLVPELDLVIPAYNEEARLYPTIIALARELRRADIAVRFIVVDNGSVDRTSDVVCSLRESLPGIELLGCARQGKGAAVRRGMMATTAPFVGFYDADGSTPASAIPAMLTLLKRGAPVVIASRSCEGASYLERQNRMRRIGGWAFRRLAAHHVAGISDTQCGCKLFSREVAHDLFATTNCRGFAFDVEVLALAQKSALAISEVPVAWSDTPGSTMGLRAGLSAVWYLRHRRASWLVPGSATL